MGCGYSRGPYPPSRDTVKVDDDLPLCLKIVSGIMQIIAIIIVIILMMIWCSFFALRI
jgi:hypothetical protein